ncbi:hypothetical protein O0544_11080 [Edwardsiella anguillarum]|nr:hypothetical protein [Edwardsiella anguillarum]
MQVLQLVETLRQAGHLDSLQLLHFHLDRRWPTFAISPPGCASRRVSTSNCISWGQYPVLRRRRRPGVDYEGTRSQSDCSVNYGLNEYANNVIWGIGDACNEHGLPHPTVITESGRAVTAHHTVLVSNIIGVERNELPQPQPPAADAPRAAEPVGHREEMQVPSGRRSLREWLHDSQLDLHDVHSQYAHGILSLSQRAWAEQQYLAICSQLQTQLDPSNRAHRPIIDELQERMADKLYVNFSLFQSMPDAWGSISCSRCCPSAGWIRCRRAAPCCWISPAIRTAPSITTSTAMA